jgi:protein required for attachment to host cells
MRPNPARRPAATQAFDVAPITWIVVAQRAEARIFEDYSDGELPVCIQQVRHPEGHLKGREIDTDRPGRNMGRSGAPRHGYSTDQDPQERIADDFARQLAELLHKGRALGTFDRIVLIAAPRFLGRLRAVLDVPTEKCVVRSVSKDFPAFLEDRELAEQIDQLLRPASAA